MLKYNLMLLYALCVGCFNIYMLVLLCTAKNCLQDPFLNKVLGFLPYIFSLKNNGKHGCPAMSFWKFFPLLRFNLCQEYVIVAVTIFT